MNMCYIKLRGRPTMIKRKTKVSVGKKLPQKYRISMRFVFGPFPSAADSIATRKKVKAKVPKIRLGGSQSASNGYKFIGETVYIKRSSAPASVLKQVIQNNAPNARVSVTKVA